VEKNNPLPCCAKDFPVKISKESRSNK